MVFEFSEAWAHLRCYIPTQNALKSQNISNHNAHTILMLMLRQPTRHLFCVHLFWMNFFWRCEVVYLALVIFLCVQSATRATTQSLAWTVMKLWMGPLSPEGTRIAKSLIGIMAHLGLFCCQFTSLLWFLLAVSESNTDNQEANQNELWHAPTTLRSAFVEVKLARSDCW